MRYARVEVRNFQVIESANVDFGPGLNVLFGANDLGKTTLACAIRAALLLPPGSSEAAAFRPWSTDASPQVGLTLIDDDGHYWKVRKTFGESGSASAELFHSKDGVHFTSDCKARQVDEALRRLLGWGIPSPGGKGAPRGLPASFLAHALLATQTDVDTILTKSIKEDVDESGKIRLTKALAALSQDPLFKKVLDVAQHEVDQYFTPKGLRKRGQGTPFADAAANVKRLSDELELLRRQVEESTAIEAVVARLREERDRAQGRVVEAEGLLEAVHARQARAVLRRDAEARLEQARDRLASIDAKRTRVLTEEHAVEALAIRVREAEANVLATAARVRDAEAAQRAAEEGLRVATSKDGERQRELQRARCDRERARWVEQIAAGEAKRDALERAIQSEGVARSAETELQEAGRGHEQAEVAVSAAKAAQAEREKACQRARAELAYARWRAAVEAQKESNIAREAAVAAREAAAVKEHAARDKEAEASTLDGQANGEKSRLPSASELEGLEQLERELAVTQAALGGGLSVSLLATGKVAVRTTVDGAELLPGESLDGRQTFEAERTLRVSVGDWLELEVVAGAADRRRQMAALRERWEREGVPVLHRAGTQSVVATRKALEAIGGIETAARERRHEATRLADEAKRLQGRASELDAKATELADRAGDLPEREAAIGTHDRASLASAIEKLGAAWERKLEQAIADADKLLASAVQDLSKCERTLSLAAYQVTEAQARVEKARNEAVETLAAIGPADGSTLTERMRRTEAELAEGKRKRSAVEAEHAALDAEATKAASTAKQAVADAVRRLEAARKDQEVAANLLTSTRSELDTQRGQVTALREELEKIDRASAQTVVDACTREAAQFANEPQLREEEVTAAERGFEAAKDALERLTRDLDQQGGALTKVGGNSVREERDRVREALDGAKERHRQLEIEADAWALLRDTLREVENEEGAHLGRALAMPVSKGFAELTRGRYRNLRLGASLSAESLETAQGAAPGGDVLDALSVGTRNQLATLFRLTIADQLKSAIVLDDHLVNTDAVRIGWFRDLLLKTALSTQVIVLTCRAEDYLKSSDLPGETAVRDLAGGAVRAIDAARVLKRADAASAGGNARSDRPPREAQTS